jgi:hypothetical protein
LQTNNNLALETFGKFAAKSIGMPLLHHKNQIRPAQQTLSYSNSCTFFSSRRSHTVATNLLANPLSSQTSPLIPAANKQYLNFIHQFKKQNAILSALIRVNPPTSAVKKRNPKFAHRSCGITKTVICQRGLNFAYNS